MEAHHYALPEEFVRAVKAPFRGVMPLMAVVLAFSAVGCVRREFAVVPRAPEYMLRAPDALETALPDVLRAYNGFERGQGWVDLRPLMGLRIENAYYVKGASRKGLDGYLGTEVAHYEVEGRGLRLGDVTVLKDRPVGDLPVQNLVSKALLGKRYYRLYFEVFHRKSDTHGSVLVGTNTREELNKVAGELASSEAECGPENCAAFPEACSVSVEMKVFVNGVATWLVWGSVLTGVVGSHPGQVNLQRLFHGRIARVEVDAADERALRLALLPGDRLVWN